MKVVTLRLEHPGENYDTGKAHHEERFRRGHMRVDEMKKHFVDRRPWVAEITGWDEKPERSFLDGHKDYKRADRRGERGVCRTFHLRSGRVYEVRHYTSWSNEERYFCRIQDGRICRLDENELHKHVADAEA